MRDYFSEDQLKGDRSVLACQVSIAQDLERLGGAFSDFGNDTYSMFYAVWIWVSYDVAERHVEPAKEELNESIWHERTSTLLSQIQRQTEGSRLSVKWGMRRIAFRAVEVAGVIVAIALMCVITVGIAKVYSNVAGLGKNSAGATVVAVIVAVGVGIFIGYQISQRIEKKYWTPFVLKMSAECYRQMWRRELLNFLARSHLPYQTFRAFIQSSPNTVASSIWVKHYVDQDYTLPVFTIAQRFVV
jgi:hypothetical protein